MAKLTSDLVNAKLQELEDSFRQKMTDLRVLLEAEALVRPKRVTQPLLVTDCKSLIARVQELTRLEANGCWSWQGRVTKVRSGPVPVIFLKDRYELVSRVLWVCKTGSDLPRNVRLFKAATCMQGCINPEHHHRKR